LAALRQLTLTAPLQLAPNNSSIRSLAHGSRSAFALDRGPWLHAGDQINVDTPLGHESSDNSAPSAKGFRIDTAATDELKQQLGLVQRTALYSKASYRAIMGTMTTISNPEVAAATRIRMSEHIKHAIPLSDKYFFAFITGKFDNLATPTTKATSTTVSLAHALADPDTYDDLDPQGVAQCIDRFADLLQRTTNMNPTENGIPTEFDRQFYNRLVQPLVTALRGRGKDSFENYDTVWLKDRFIQDILTAHRSVINMGVQRSGPQLKAALEEIWHTLRGFDFRALMALQVEWERHLKDHDYAAKAARVAARKVVQAKADADTKAAGITVSKQTKPNASTSSGTGGSVGATTNVGKTAPAPDRLPCVPELLYNLQLGPKCRNASTNCKFEHFLSYKDCLNRGTRDRAALKQFMLQHPIVTAKGSANAKWLTSVSAKIDSI